MNKFDAKCTFKLNEPFNIKIIQDYCRNNPSKKIIVEVQNTKGITSEMINQLSQNVSIRIAGGYDQNRINRYGKDIFLSSNYYYDAVIYSRNETIKILQEIEKIEEGMYDNWTNIQKTLYVYDKLKRKMMYEPEYEKKLSDEIRSLRGLVSKQTVCAGYAIIFKEIMDRNNIDCEYVEGHTRISNDGKREGGHAWNIVNINGKKYPIDLTWDNTKFRKGDSKSLDWFFQDVKKFSERHIPLPLEKTQDYIHTLSQVEPSIIKSMYGKMGLSRTNEYETVTYKITRKDGSQFILSQIGNAKIDGKEFFKYHYTDIKPNGKKDVPIILYSKNNYNKYIDYKNFGNKRNCESDEEYKRKLMKYSETVKKLELLFENNLFSKENITDSFSKGTYYIGGFDFNKPVNQKIEKEPNYAKKFNHPTKRITRSDATVLTIQNFGETNINGYVVRIYDIFEVVNENGHEILKQNVVYTDYDFFDDIRQSMIDEYLGRKRLDRKSKETGGYIGFFNDKGIKKIYEDLNKYFDISTKIDLDQFEQNGKHGR